MLSDADVVGTWRLIEYAVDVEGQEPEYPLGRDATGLIIYTADGYMSAQISAAGRDPWPSSDFSASTTEQRAEAASTYLAYSGPFRLAEGGTQIVHNMRIALFPNWAGSPQIRLAELIDGVLHLTSQPLDWNGHRGQGRITWRRADPLR